MSNKNLAFLIPLVIFSIFFIAACGSPDIDKGAQVIKKVFTEANAGNYEEAENYLSKIDKHFRSASSMAASILNTEKPDISDFWDQLTGDQSLEELDVKKVGKAKLSNSKYIYQYTAHLEGGKIVKGRMTAFEEDGQWKISFIHWK